MISKMSKILKVRKVSDYISHLGGEVRHPFVGVVDYAALSPIPHSLNNYGVYGVFMHKHLSVDLTYGCGKYERMPWQLAAPWQAQPTISVSIIPIISVAFSRRRKVSLLRNT